MTRRLWLVLVACSGHPGEPTHPGSAAPVAIDAPQPAVANGPSERECDDLIDHALAVRMTELRATRPADQLPTEAELARTRSELRADPGCRSLSRDGYRCAIAAKTLAELEGCYLTRSSSTSNSSVAPGGMTPAAPRSP